MSPIQTTEPQYDCIIIGAGPAGMSAGVYLARRQLKTLILSKDIGGQAAWSSDVENYLGYHLVSGTELAAKFAAHLKDFDIQLIQGADVKSIAGQAPEFIVTTQDGVYHSKSVLIAAGKTPRKLNVPGEQEFLGKGVIYCATCDAPLFKNKEVAVIGGGNSALDAVMQLDKLATKVYLINLMDTFAPTADAILVSRLSQSPKIEVIMSSQTKEIKGSKVVESLIIEDTKTKASREIPVQGVFIEIGSEPSVSYLPSEMKLNQWKEIIIDDHNMTSIEGIFAGGDVTEVIEKQVVIAAGEGAKAALGVSRFLETHHYAESSKQQY